MGQIEIAILRTILYADVFDFPLTLDELHRYLIHDRAISRSEIEQALATSPLLHHKLCQHEGYISLSNRPQLIAIRQQRTQLSADLWPVIRRYGRWLAWLPFVRMVSVTGALAMHNPSSANDDFDYLLVTAPGRVWLARGLAVLMVRIVRLFGHHLCPNYVLASDCLMQTRQDLYLAHEVVQMRPLYGGVIYQQMLDCNAWTRDYLPNATAYISGPSRPNIIKRALETLFKGRLGDWLENWEYRRKLRKLQPEIASDAAALDSGQVKGHFNDHGERVLAAYRARLAQHNLTPLDLLIS